MGRIIPYIMENKQCLKPPTRKIKHRNGKNKKNTPCVQPIGPLWKKHLSMFLLVVCKCGKSWLVLPYATYLSPESRLWSRALHRFTDSADSKHPGRGSRVSNSETCSALGDLAVQQRRLLFGVQMVSGCSERAPWDPHSESKKSLLGGELPTAS